MKCEKCGRDASPSYFAIKNSDNYGICNQCQYFSENPEMRPDKNQLRQQRIDELAGLWMEIGNKIELIEGRGDEWRYRATEAIFNAIIREGE